ncbi:MAG: glycoside hydrolase family 113 [Candidatus Sumerlaeaceae bacterium]
MARHMRSLICAMAVLVELMAIEGAAQTTVTEKIKGISYAAWWPGDYSKPDADLALGKLAATGAKDVSIIVTQYQPTIDSTTIAPAASTPTDEDVTHAIRMAKNLGLRVLLKPHVDLSADPTHWRGQIGTNFDETQWAQWFASYQSFILHYAQIAAAENVERFCVGTELLASRPRASQWRSVIAAVRSVFPGELVYAANFDPHPADISWWDAVDYIGIDAYYPLSTKDDPTTAELAAAWAAIVPQLNTLATSWTKPIVFTEIGYRSLDGANKHPWDWQIAGSWDLQEQKECYEAALQAVWNQPWFAGMYWWSWETELLQGGPCDTGYTPADKPAEDVVRQWYGGPPDSDPPLPTPNPAQQLPLFDEGLPAGWENWSWGTTSVNFTATDQVTSGSTSISAVLMPWGGLHLHGPNISTNGFSYLEFYARKAAGAQSFRVLLFDDNAQALRRVRLEDCRYTAGTPIDVEQWTLVRVPLEHLDAVNRTISGIAFQNWSDSSAQIWVDAARLIGGTPVPVVVSLLEIE